MRHAPADSGLKRPDLVHAGDETYPLAEGIHPVGLERLLTDLEPLR